MVEREIKERKKKSRVGVVFDPEKGESLKQLFVFDRQSYQARSKASQTNERMHLLQAPQYTEDDDLGSLSYNSAVLIRINVEEELTPIITR